LWLITEEQMDSRDIEAVLKNTSEILELSRDLPQQRAIGLVFHGWALMVSGKIAEGLAHTNEGVAWLERSAFKGIQARLLCPAAETYFLADRHAEGLRLIEKGLQDSNAFCRPRLLQVQAKLLQAMGRGEQAEACLAQSLDLARAQGAKLN